MAAGILFGCVVPHPPVLLPEVGGEMAREVEPTVQALEDLGRRIAGYEPQTLVLISPHGPVLRDSMAIGLAKEAQGGFANFQAPEVTLSVRCDTELAAAIESACSRVAIPVTPVDRLTRPDQDADVYWLDHGAAVPLHFLLPIVGDVKVVVLGYSWLPRATHQAFGDRIRQVCRDSGRRVVFVASGDLSHRLTRTAPAGYDPQGQVFDEEIIAGIAAGDWQRIRNLSPELVERAGVCGYHSILTLAGTMGEEVRTRVLSYQGPFGVGYLVAEVEPDAGSAGAGPTAEQVAVGESSKAAAVDIRQTFAFDPDLDFGQNVLRLARASLEAYVHTGFPLSMPEETPEGFRVRQSCFVTLRSGGQLRGCVGTVEPVRDSLAQEIMENAVSAGQRDYRFYPVQGGELAELAYSVDVLSPPEAIPDLSVVDPAQHGLVVRQAGRTGVLLPGIPEIATAQQQFEVCCQKAGITSPDGVQLSRFTVDRYAEPGAEH